LNPTTNKLPIFSHSEFLVVASYPKANRTHSALRSNKLHPTLLLRKGVQPGCACTLGAEKISSFLLFMGKKGKRTQRAILKAIAD
jgi:hypothetical protein